ncbi:MAG TPA: T9SS type A sorting domain-containing protein [Bacteroidia bacterium]|nr:T9SS type A sorting domain-containing protein [Bacteroidia bacterium]
MKKKYKTFFLLIPFAICLMPSSFSQTAPGIEWQNTIGGSSSDVLYDIQQTADNGYILGGSSFSNISGDKTENSNGAFDYWIVKTGASGNIQWQNTIGGSDNDELHSIRQTTDGGYILGGHSWSNISGDKIENCIGGWDYWIVKTDSLGTIQWQNTIGGNDYDYLFSIEQTSDGGYILGGYSFSIISGDKTENGNGLSDYWPVKTDASGIVQWENSIGGSTSDALRSIEQTADGGYILGGRSNSNISGDKTENCIGGTYLDYWIVKTDASGIIQWQNTIGGTNGDELFSIQQTNDGGYILGGHSWSNISGDKTENSCNNTFDYWIVKTDATGNIQWQKTIGGNSADYLRSIQQTADGGYILGGYSWSGISCDKTENNWDTTFATSDYWIVKTDTSGIIQWEKTIGGNNEDWLYSIQQTADGGYILGGWSTSNISGDKTENSNGTEDYWIVKLFPDTITGITQLPQLPNFPISIFPNPLTTQSKLTFKNPSKEKFLFTLYDITGRITENVSTTNKEIILTKGSKQHGVYLFNFMNEKRGERWNGKIVISN